MCSGLCTSKSKISTKLVFNKTDTSQKITLNLMVCFLGEFFSGSLRSESGILLASLSCTFSLSGTGQQTCSIASRADLSLRHLGGSPAMVPVRSSPLGGTAGLLRFTGRDRISARLVRGALDQLMTLQYILFLPFSLCYLPPDSGLICHCVPVSSSSQRSGLQNLGCFADVYRHRLDRFLPLHKGRVCQRVGLISSSSLSS